MKVVRYSDGGYSARLAELKAGSSLFDAVIEERTRGILAKVRAEGDAALVELTERFDGARLTAEQLPVTQAELMTASLKADESTRAAVKEAMGNIEKFAKRSMRKDWEMRNAHGARVGEKFDPFTRVGIYIPGGTAPLVSTALMTVTLARSAGCPEIVVCTPCAQDGTINPALLYAAKAAGATEIYRVGGAQAIAAMAYGTKTIRRTQKIFGPGNAYVVTAKRLVVGHVAIDLLPGPSELLVLADESANARFVAADMLAQAEHGSGHERVWLVTTSEKLMKGVEREIAKQLNEDGTDGTHGTNGTNEGRRLREGLRARLRKDSGRRTFVQKALEGNGWLVRVRTMEDGVKLVNELAPEHCEVMTREAREVSEGILTAGAIFLGSWSPTVLGDYVAGPSHTLPTGGAGASFAGLTVDQFQRRTSVVEYGRGALKKALAGVRKFAELEGLEAHGRSAEVRGER
jgi:histidinol dehydrogenase